MYIITIVSVHDMCYYIYNKRKEKQQEKVMVIDMIFYKYRVFNYTKKKFEILICGASLEVGEFKILPQGELQIFELIKTF